MTTNLLVVIIAAGLVAATGLALGQDKTSQRTKPRLVSPHEAQTVATATSTNSAPDYPVIGYLEKRGHCITIKGGPTGSLYSVKKADGKVVCENVSAEHLRAEAPEIADFLKAAVAGPAGGKGDARVEPRRYLSILSR